MTDLVRIDPPPPPNVPLRVDRPIYLYGDYYVGMAPSLDVRPNFVWLAYNIQGARVAYAATKERLVIALENL